MEQQAVYIATMKAAFFVFPFNLVYLFGEVHTELVWLFIPVYGHLSFSPSLHDKMLSSQSLPTTFILLKNHWLAIKR